MHIFRFLISQVLLYFLARLVFLLMTSYTLCLCMFGAGRPDLPCCSALPLGGTGSVQHRLWPRPQRFLPILLLPGQRQWRPLPATSLQPAERGPWLPASHLLSFISIWHIGCFTVQPTIVARMQNIDDSWRLGVCFVLEIWLCLQGKYSVVRDWSMLQPYPLTAVISCFFFSTIKCFWALLGCFASSSTPVLGYGSELMSAVVLYGHFV
jgi:hypothetical protein